MRWNNLYCGAAIAALLSTPALAQTPPQSAADQATVEDVIVTSRRREEQIQEAPASIVNATRYFPRAGTARHPATI